MANKRLKNYPSLKVGWRLGDSFSSSYIQNYLLVEIFKEHFYSFYKGVGGKESGVGIAKVYLCILYTIMITFKSLRVIEKERKNKVMNGRINRRTNRRTNRRLNGKCSWNGGI